MDTIAEFIHRVINLCVEVQKKSGKLLKDFITAFENDEEAKKIRQDVVSFSIQFKLPGTDVSKFKK